MNAEHVAAPAGAWRCDKEGSISETRQKRSNRNYGRRDRVRQISSIIFAKIREGQPLMAENRANCPESCAFNAIGSGNRLLPAATAAANCLPLHHLHRRAGIAGKQSHDIGAGRQTGHVQVEPVFSFGQVDVPCLQGFAQQVDNAHARVSGRLGADVQLCEVVTGLGDTEMSKRPLPGSFVPTARLRSPSAYHTPQLWLAMNWLSLPDGDILSAARPCL